DRAVRFYRRYFWTFILIASPPILTGMVFTIAWTSLARWLFITGNTLNQEEYFLYYLFTGLGSMFIWFTVTTATLVVMGGASRNFVRHLLYGEAITFRETYANTRSRLWPLIAASVLVIFLVGIISFFLFYFTIFVWSIAFGIAVLIFQYVPALMAIVSIILTVGILGGGIFLFFW